MTGADKPFWLQFEYFTRDPVAASKNTAAVTNWHELPMRFHGTIDALKQLMDDVCGENDTDMVLEATRHAVAIARTALPLDRHDIIIVERRGLRPERLAALIGFIPTSKHVNWTLEASEAVHAQTRLHQLLARGRQVPLESLQHPYH